jgi:hypothetical protein
MWTVEAIVGGKRYAGKFRGAIAINKYKRASITLAYESLVLRNAKGAIVMQAHKESI